MQGIKLELNRKVFITGSSRGIGAATARLARSFGWDVVLHGKANSSHLIDLSDELGCGYVTFDAADEQEVDTVVSSLKGINALVNCAGINISRPFEELSVEDWEKLYRANVVGVANVIRAFLDGKSARNDIDRIVNIGSVKGTHSGVGRVAYASTKAAVINLSAGLAKELSPGILVNCVSPGFVDTSMTEETMSSRIKAQIDSTLLKRMALPLEIAEVICFLISSKCSYITGQNIIVDGGFTIKAE